MPSIQHPPHPPHPLSLCGWRIQSLQRDMWLLHARENAAAINNFTNNKNLRK
jgi:hypothetical protein